MKALLAAVEASYAAVATGDVDAWMSATCEALVPVIGVPSRGTLAYRYDLTKPDAKDWTLSEPIVRDGSPALALAVTSSFAFASDDERRALYRADTRVTTMSEVSGETLDEMKVPGVREFSEQLGVKDVLGLHAGSPNGLGAMFAAGIPNKKSLRPAERWSLARLTSHLAAAHRLVMAVERTPVVVATFDATDGKLLDQSDIETTKPLRTAVKEMIRARNRSRKSVEEEDESLSLWHALVDGRYSLLDRFESDGKRFVVAVENPPTLLADPRGLTSREHAVAGLLAMALPDKLIAYELGLQEGTVRAHVHSILQKLGVATRAAATLALSQPRSTMRMTLGDDQSATLVVFSDDSFSEQRMLSLSAVEREVAELAARGISTDAIAKKRNRSAATVAKQLASAFDKLGVTSRAELARYLTKRD